MTDKTDDVDATPAPKRTLKLKTPRVERPPAAVKPVPTAAVPGLPSEERPNFLSRIDHIKRQMQADMDALADPKPPSKRR